MSRRPRPLLLFLILFATACATGGSAPAAGIRQNPYMITSEELQTSPAKNAYELVQFLRPRWLQKQGAYSLRDSGDIVVYLDRTRLGGPESLRQIEVSAVSAMRFYNALDAQALFGLSHNYGAIQVVMERGR
jgi:hypothetical protein